MYPLLSDWILPENKRGDYVLRYYIKDLEISRVEFAGFPSFRHQMTYQLLQIRTISSRKQNEK